MIRSVLFLSFLLVSIHTFSQFAPMEYLIRDTVGYIPIRTADMDLDGFQDVVSAFSATGEIVVFYGTGTEEFIGPDTIFNEDPIIETLELADIDGNGLVDVVFQKNIDLYFLRNLGGGSFGVKELIADSAFFTEPFTMADADGDGDHDLLIASLKDSVCHLLLNDGSGDYSTSIFIDSLQQSYVNWRWNRNVFFTDSDGNGTADIVLSNLAFGSHFPRWMSNDGLGNFTFGDSLPWAIDVIAVVDFEGDGDEDLVSKYVIFRNDGNGNYSYDQFSDPCGPNEITKILAVGDVDNDGDQDLVVITDDAGSNQYPAVQWVETVNGTPDICFTVTRLIPQAGALIDIDNNGSLELVTSSGYIALFDTQIFTGQYDTDLIYASRAGAGNMQLIDADNDNDLDLITTPLGQVLLHTNDGMEFNEHLIHQTHKFINVITAKGDISGNGLLDLLIGDNDSLYWFSNGSFLSGPSGAIRARGDIRDIILEDINNDGFDDIVCTDTSVYWLENLSSGQFGPPQNLMNEYATTTLAADLDQDGDIDIMTYTFSNGLELVENIGGGVFTAPVAQDTVYYPFSLEAWNLDQDAELEVLFKSNYYLSPFYLDNIAGIYQAVPSILPEGVLGMDYGDINGNGNVDIVVVNDLTGKDELYTNDGMGNFSILELDSVSSDRRFEIADLNGDGVRDIFCSRRSGIDFYWYQNYGGSVSITSNDASLVVNTAPNPFSENATVYLKQPVRPGSVLMIFDLSGKLIRSIPASGNSIDIPRNSLPNGMYIIKVIEDGEIIGRAKLIAE